MPAVSRDNYDSKLRAARPFALVLGLGMLLTYNFLLNCIPWFISVYGDTRFAYYATLGLTYPGLAIQFLMLPAGRLVPAALRIRASICLNLIVLCVLPLIAPMSSGAGLTLLVISGIATSVMEASLFGFFSAFPSDWNGAVVSGQGLAGLVASTIQVITKASMEADSQSTVTNVYCGIGACVLAVCLACHFTLVRIPAVKAVLERSKPSSGLNASSKFNAASAGHARAPTAEEQTSRDGDSDGRRLIHSTSSTVGAEANDIDSIAVTAEASTVDGASDFALPSGNVEVASAGPEGHDDGSAGQWRRLHVVRRMSMGVPQSQQPQLNPINSAISNTPSDANLEVGSAKHVDAGSAAGSSAWGAPTNTAAAASAAATRRKLQAARRVGSSNVCCVGSGSRCFEWLEAEAEISCPSVLAWAYDMARVLRVVAVPAAVVSANFIATFLPFPGLLATVPYRGSVSGAVIQPFVDDPSWWFTVLLLVYSVFDVCGRYAADCHPPVPEWALVLYALCRFAWTPIIAGCAYHWTSAFDDALVVAAVAGFAATNGHLATLCFRQGPQKAVPVDRELAGFIMAAALHIGIVVGSNMALAFTGC